MLNLLVGVLKVLCTAVRVIFVYIFYPMKTSQHVCRLWSNKIVTHSYSNVFNRSPEIAGCDCVGRTV